MNPVRQQRIQSLEEVSLWVKKGLVISLSKSYHSNNNVSIFLLISNISLTVEGV